MLWRLINSVQAKVAFDDMEFGGTELSLKGLNLQAVININELPSDVVKQLAHSCDRLKHYSQLILIGHGGRLLWQKIKESGFHSDNPVDDFSSHHTHAFFSQRFPAADFELIFPGSNQKQNPIGLQALGEIAGWHNKSPFRVGINQEWGSWFAYRAVVLVKSDYLPTTISKSSASNSISPCKSCEVKACIQTCPADALVGDGLDLNQCISYRKQEGSKCKDRCIARMACPVAELHQYKLEQIQYHYSLSMRTIERMDSSSG